MNIAPKIANKISKCSEKQHLNVSSILHVKMSFLIAVKLKLNKMAELNQLLEIS